MASNKTTETGSLDRELKCLWFIRVIAIKAIVCVWRMYEYAKQHSGPFKSMVGIVESLATAVVTPIYDKVKGFPDDVLVFLDNKVDKVINKLEELALALTKKVVSRVQPLLRKPLQRAEKLLREALTAALIAAIRYVGMESLQLLPNPLENVLDGVNKIPTLDLIEDTAAKGLSVLGNVPLVPLDGIANVLNKLKGDAEATSSEAGKKTE